MICMEARIRIHIGSRVVLRSKYELLCLLSSLCKAFIHRVSIYTELLLMVVFSTWNSSHRAPP